MTRPSTELRANGNYIDNIDHFPFVLRLSKHERIFSHTLSPPRLRGESSISSQLANNFDYCSTVFGVLFLIKNSLLRVLRLSAVRYPNCFSLQRPRAAKPRWDLRGY